MTAMASPAPVAAPSARAKVLAPSAIDYDTNRFNVGIEAFYDNYTEPETFPSLESHSLYGAVDLGYDYYFSPTGFVGFEGRASRGNENYKSDSGSIHNVPQWEFEARFLGGSDRDLGQDHRIKLYAGLGSRYYIDELKDKVTNLGALGYERRIFHVYIPIGVTYEFPAYGFTFAPNLEIDPLLYGNVQSRFENIGLEEFNNRQSYFSGVGIRGEFMVKQRYENGLGWEFGPFFRTWNFADSEPDFNSGGGGIEPQNIRTQIGAKLKVRF